MKTWKPLRGCTGRGVRFTRFVRGLTVGLGAILLFVLGFPSPSPAAPGDLDMTFGSGGKVLTELGGFDQARALALQPDGKIIVGGVSFGDFALARYLPDGSLDPTFGTGGSITGVFGSTASLFALAIQPEGRIVAGGTSFAAPGGGNFALVRHDANGTLDVTFGSEGKVITDFGGDDEALALVLQPDGKIVMAGFSGANFALARYNPDGTLDSTFGSGGRVIINPLRVPSSASALVLQPDGKIVVAGSSADNFALARYRGDPTLFLDLTVNKTTFTPGDMLEIDTRMANSGPDTVVDEYLGALLPPEVGPAFGCPGNDAVVFVTETGGAVLTCLSAPPQTFPPFARNVTVPADLPMTVTPNVLSFVWPADAPAGTYVVFRAFVRSGAVADGSLGPGDLLALAAAGLSFTP